MAEAQLLVATGIPYDPNITDKWEGVMGRDDHLVTLPLNLFSIGIRHVLNIGDDLSQTFTLANARAGLIDHFSIEAGGEDWNNLQVGSIIILTRHYYAMARYQVIQRLGGGAFGNIFRVRFIGTIPHVPGSEVNLGRICLIKVQQKPDDIDNNTFVYKTILEGTIQHIVHLATAHKKHHDVPYTSEIFSVGITNPNNFFTVIIMEEIRTYGNHGTLTNILNAVGRVPPNHLIPLNMYVKNIMRKLISLNTFYNFNHADFHANNVLIDEGHNARIIDFGFSTIRLKGYVWRCNNCGTQNLNSSMRCRNCNKERVPIEIANISHYLTLSVNNHIYHEGRDISTLLIFIRHTIPNHMRLSWNHMMFGNWGVYNCVRYFYCNGDVNQTWTPAAPDAIWEFNPPRRSAENLERILQYLDRTYPIGRPRAPWWLGRYFDNPYVPWGYYKDPNIPLRQAQAVAAAAGGGGFRIPDNNSPISLIDFLNGFSGLQPIEDYKGNRLPVGGAPPRGGLVVNPMIGGSLITYNSSGNQYTRKRKQSPKQSPKQPSEKINVATSSKSLYIEMPIFTHTTITLNNLFEYYQYLRFNVFKNAKNLKRLFKLLITRNILNPEIGNNLQKLVDKSKIIDVIEYLENLPEDLSMIYSVEFKNLDEIIKIYLNETDQTLAHDVLQYLIYLKFESKELFNIYVNVYYSFTDYNYRRPLVPRVAYYLPRSD